MGSSSGTPSNNTDALHQSILSKVKYINIEDHRQYESLQKDCNSLIEDIMRLKVLVPGSDIYALKICASNTVHFIQSMVEANRSSEVVFTIKKINLATFNDYLLSVANAKHHYKKCIDLTSSVIFFSPSLMHAVKEKYLNKIVDLEIIKSELYKNLYDQAKSQYSLSRMIAALEHMQEAHLSISACIAQSYDKKLSITKETIDGTIKSTDEELEQLTYEASKVPSHVDAISPRLFTSQPPAHALAPIPEADEPMENLPNEKSIKLLSPTAIAYVPIGAKKP